jgi:xanthine dehydrogenase small subunit
MADSDRVAFTCDGAPVEVDVPAGTTLLDVLREDLGVRTVKDGCAPQGQCGCCTVLVDGQPRVACVTPAARVAGRSVTTVDGLDERVRERLLDAFVDAGGSQCGFCTPGIVVRAAWLLQRTSASVSAAEIDRALAAHLCRCTGWLTVREAILEAGAPVVARARERDLAAAGRRAELEGGGHQAVAASIPRGEGGFADDTAPDTALVAVPLTSATPDALGHEPVEAAGVRFVVGQTLREARARAGKVQGRRTTQSAAPPLAPPPSPAGGVVLATSWVEPAYLEPDASWCMPDGAPASPLANGGAFGGKVASPAPAAARELAHTLGRPVRVVLAREDVVRLGPKRPPVSASAVVIGKRVTIAGSVIGPLPTPSDLPYRLDLDEQWSSVTAPGLRTSAALRAWPLAERTVLVEGAMDAAGLRRVDLVRDERTAAVLLDACAVEPTDGALAGAAVEVDAATGTIARVQVRLAAGDPLDEIVLRSYAIGATHMALGWVLTESLTVDPGTGEVLDLTIRSFGIIRAQDMPPVEVTIIDEAGPPRRRSSDAVFAAVAAATWNAVARADATRPDALPALGTRASQALRR